PVGVGERAALGHLYLVGCRMQVVGVDEGPSEPLGDGGADFGFSRAGDAQHDDGTWYRGHSSPWCGVPAGSGVIVVTVVGWARNCATAASRALTSGPAACAAKASRESHFSIIVIVPSSASWMA